MVGISRAEVAATLRQMLTTIALLTLGGLLLLAAATAWTIRAGLAPLRSIADTAERVSKLPLDQGEVSISERVPDRESDPRTEVGRVGEALNTLLDHVDESLDARQRNEARMRRFVADASHELRTPLASIRGYSELSLRALAQSHDPLTLETTEASLDRIQAQSLRMTTLVEDLLLLARLDEGQELVYGTVDLSRLAIEAVGDARPAGPDHNWVLDVGEEPVTDRRRHRAPAPGRGEPARERPHAHAGGHDRDRERGDATGRMPSSACTTTARASTRRSRPSCSSASHARTARAPARPAAPDSGCRSSARSSRRTAARSPCASEPGDTTFEVRLPMRSTA